MLQACTSMRKVYVSPAQRLVLFVILLVQGHLRLGCLLRHIGTLSHCSALNNGTYRKSCWYLPGIGTADIESGGKVLSQSPTHVSDVTPWSIRTVNLNEVSFDLPSPPAISSKYASPTRSPWQSTRRWTSARWSSSWSSWRSRWCGPSRHASWPS